MKLNIRSIVVLVFAACLGCSQPLPEIISCPNLAHKADRLLTDGGPLTLGQKQSGQLKPDRFSTHAIAIPAAGGFSLTVELTLESVTVTPVLFVYGPRNDAGFYDTCVSQVGRGEPGQTLVVHYQVPTNGGGEFLVLAAASPLDLADSSYQVLVECNGEGCEDEVCPTLAALGCPQANCPSGFTLAETESGLVCPTCECEELDCGPHKKLVFDTCVCDCPPAAPANAVCGQDGQTWPSACHAQCNEVAVANEQGSCTAVCPQLGCDLLCVNGLKTQDGCAICECVEDPCDSAPAFYQPVCGTDGLSYRNAIKARCNPGVEVAYLGSCLPFCLKPAECSLSCEFGYMPSIGPNKPCFECLCMEAVPKFKAKTCSGDSPYWCARRAFSQSGGGAQTTQPDVRYRTFANFCSAKAADWKPLFGAACITGVCLDNADCKPGNAVLKKMPWNSDQNVFCNNGDQNAIGQKNLGACTIDAPQAQSCDDAAPCAKGMDCKQGMCRHPCTCLNTHAARAYDPVCVNLLGGPRTYFNSCMAFCDGKGPVLYPGRCCDQRQTSEELIDSYTALETHCQGQGQQLHANVRLDNACPPSVASCGPVNTADIPPDSETVTEELCCKTFQKPPGLEPVEP